MKALLLLTWLLIAGAGYYAYQFYQDTLAHEQESEQGLVVAHATVADLTVQVTALKEQVSTLKAHLADENKAANASAVALVPLASPVLPVATAGDQSAPGSIPSTITTLSGKTYTGCVLSKVTPDGISFTHSMGVAKILFPDLDPIFAATFGYDPVAAQKYEEDQAVLASQSDAHRAAVEAHVPASNENNVAQSTAASDQPPPAKGLSPEQRVAIQSRMMTLEQDIAFLKRETDKEQLYDETGNSTGTRVSSSGSYGNKMMEEQAQFDALKRELNQ